VFLVALWAVVTETEIVSPFVLAPPLDVVEGISSLVGEEFFAASFWTTMQEALLGFGLAAAGGFVLAVVLAHVPVAERSVLPLLIVFQVIPKVALAPIFIIWLGFGIGAKVAVAFALTFFVIVLNTLAGFASVPANSRQLMRSMRASRRQTFCRLTLPTALPLIFSGLKVGVTLGLVGAIVGEYIQSRTGLGQLLVRYSGAGRMDLVWAVVVVVSFVGGSLYAAIALVQHRVAWWES
jgi:NitT/TauT family transport system permease protein